MTVEWFDLGQRLVAAAAGRPVARLVHAPVPAPQRPVAVRASRTAAGRVTLTAATPEHPARTARGAAGLGLLADLGVRLSAARWATLVTDDAATLPALLHLARAATSAGAHGDVAAHVGWWADRAEYPGGSAVLALGPACRARWTTGATPDSERHAGTWRTWLDVADDGCRGLLDLAARVSDGPVLPLLQEVLRGEEYAWTRAQAEHADGWNWRATDTVGRAAVALRGRCDTADLHAAALLDDPLHRRRAVHTGHVVVGTVTVGPGPREPLHVACDRMDARLRVGTQVTGWTGTPDASTGDRFSGSVSRAAVQHGQLVLTVTGATVHRPGCGARVTLRPAPPSVHQMTSGRSRVRRLYGTRTSWLTTGRTPTPTRRDVPLDVLVAAAE